MFCPGYSYVGYFVWFLEQNPKQRLPLPLSAVNTMMVILCLMEKERLTGQFCMWSVCLFFGEGEGELVTTGEEGARAFWDFFYLIDVGEP